MDRLGKMRGSLSSSGIIGHGSVKMEGQKQGTEFRWLSIDTSEIAFQKVTSVIQLNFISEYIRNI